MTAADPLAGTAAEQFAATGERGGAALLEAGSDDWLEAAALIIRAAMIDVYAPRACVAGCRIGIEVLRYFRIDADAHPMRVLVITQDAMDWHALHGWDTVAPVGHSLGIGYSTTLDAADRFTEVDGFHGWDAHLVLRLPGRDRIVDITIDQTHRPDRGLMVPRPLVAELPDEWPGDDQGRMHVYGSGADGSTLIIYQALYGPAAQQYRQVRDWRANTDSRRTVAGRAIRSIRELTA